MKTKDLKTLKENKKFLLEALSTIEHFIYDYDNNLAFYNFKENIRCSIEHLDWNNKVICFKVYFEIKWKKFVINKNIKYKFYWTYFDVLNNSLNKNKSYKKDLDKILKEFYQSIAENKYSILKRVRWKCFPDINNYKI